MLPCFQPNDSEWVVFIGEALRRAASLSPFNINKFASFVTDYFNSLSPEVKACFGNSSDMQRIEAILGIQGLDIPAIKDKAISNAIKHLFPLLSAIKATNTDWNTNHQWAQAGTDGVQIAYQLFIK
eukprot:TRINITY_DN0_c2321_g1_i2.p2 TRINITY_DN0_c2321_g1~~TRINITY_DN0_c2321_g1_i2.p2  ORF type:complete len:126 (-),score=36.90 TRINITY_DN0_c2321_g1_i2:75-452(-)